MEHCKKNNSLVFYPSPNAQVNFVPHAINRDTVTSAMAAHGIMGEKLKYWLVQVAVSIFDMKTIVKLPYMSAKNLQLNPHSVSY